MLTYRHQVNKCLNDAKVTLTIQVFLPDYLFRFFYYFFIYFFFYCFEAFIMYMFIHTNKSKYFY